jgi:hypothetical protein
VRLCLSLKGKNIDRECLENKVPRRLFGPKEEEVAGGWAKLHNEMLHPSPVIARVIKARRLRWAEQCGM